MIMEALPPAIKQGARLAYVVDDDADVRASLGFLLDTAEISSRAFPAAEDFLEELPELQPGCVIVDVRMPGMDGIGMLEELTSTGIRWPIIVITAHAEVPTAVRAMKLGATEFLRKPFGAGEMIAALEFGYEHLSGQVTELESARNSALRIGRLTPRERAVFEGVVAGLSNKRMAARLGLSPRTVEMHRTRMMRRAGASSVAELISIAHCMGLRTAAGGSPSPRAL